MPRFKDSSMGPSMFFYSLKVSSKKLLKDIKCKKLFNNFLKKPSLGSSNWKTTKKSSNKINTTIHPKTKLMIATLLFVNITISYKGSKKKICSSLKKPSMMAILIPKKKRKISMIFKK